MTLFTDCRRAEFVRADNLENLPQLRGSKCFQTRVSDTYLCVKKDLDNGVPVLFTGDGYQINDMKAFLRKDYNNLFCVDVICHGFPSPALWRKYVEHLEDVNVAKRVSINFRYKNYSWTHFGINENDANHKRFISPRRKIHIY